MIEKYIFLDIDGVIATQKTIIDGMWGLTPEKQDLLGIILNKTNAKIVISSSWRYNTLSDTIKYMKKQGFQYCDKIVGITIRAYHFLKKSNNLLTIPRGVEIDSWLKNHVIYPWYAYPDKHKDYEIINEDGSFKMMKSLKLGVDFNYVILDDDQDMLFTQSNNFICCDGYEGLTLDNTNKAIEILNKYD